jgi:hypothetical protein
MSDFRWYKDVFISRVMVRDDSSQPFWKEKFINGLPSLFAHKIKQVLVNEDNIIEYDNFTYGNLVSIIQKEGLKMCIDMKISNTANKDKRKAKYEMGNFCEQYGLPPVAPSRRHKTHKSSNDKPHKRFKNFKKEDLNLMMFFIKNMDLSLGLTNQNKDLKMVATNVARKAILQLTARPRKPLNNSKSLMKNKKT